MQSQSELLKQQNTIKHQFVHVLVAGLWNSGKDKLIHHLSEVPLEQVNIAEGLIPVTMPELLMGELQVDSKLTTSIWGAPDQWRHDYVNYLVNIKNILNGRGHQHRVMGLIVVVNSLPTASSEHEGKMVRLIHADWSLPYIIVANNPYDSHARSPETIRQDYGIEDDVTILPYDITQKADCQRVLIDLMYRTM